MKKTLLILALALLPSSALAVESVSFAALHGWFGGSRISYDGAGGPLIAGNPAIDPIFGAEFNGNVLFFTTGPNIQEAPGLFPVGAPEQPYLSEGGGASSSSPASGGATSAGRLSRFSPGP